MGNNVLIETKDLSKSFGKKKVIDKLNLNIEQGEIHGFLGLNGSGKTTTIRLLLGLIFPDEGTISINGYNIKTEYKKAISRIGAIVETPLFFKYMTGYQNLEYISGFYPDIKSKRVVEVLEMVGLRSRANDKVGTYSLGMKQRLGIAAALINKPSIVILDEPTNGLDPFGMKEVRETVVRLAEETGISFFISSHLLHEIEQMCSKVSVLSQGKLVVQGRVQNLLTATQEEVEIVTLEKEKCFSFIKNCEYVCRNEQTPNGITVNVKKGNSGRLLRYLVENNVPIEYFIPRNPSLEEFFMKQAGGGEKVVYNN